METFTQLNKYYAYIVITVLLITKDVVIGLTGEDAKNEHDHVEMPAIEREFNSQLANDQHPTPFIAELLIICDKDFGSLFQHDSTKILNYWKAYIWDVNNRFKTLIKTNITFHIASLKVMSIHDNNWEPLEKSRIGGKVSLATFLPEFAKWTYTKWAENSLTGYDIVIGVTGLPYTGDESGYSYRRGSCQFNPRDSKVYSTAVLTDRGDFRVGTLSHELAHILGAKHDYQCEDKPTYHIMDYSNWRGVTLQFKFSQCSDQDISDFLKNPVVSYCLQKQNSENFLYKPKEYPEVIPPSINEQCKRLLGRETALLLTRQYSSKICRRVECGLRGINREVEYIRTYTPVDNSDCKNKTGVCFRGTCRPRLGSETVNISSFTSTTNAVDTEISNNVKITSTTVSISTSKPRSVSSTSSSMISNVGQSSMLNNVIDENNLTKSSSYSIRNIDAINFVNILILMHLILKVLVLY